MERSAEDFCRAILQRGDLPSKLRPPRDGDGKLLQFAEPGGAPLVIETPARDDSLRLQKGGERLPQLRELHDPNARAVCLRRFAHHELQAIELFAWGALRFFELPLSLRRGFLLVLEEEQQHLQLYLDRLTALGATFGDGSLSDYLWQHRVRIEAEADPALAFLCALGLTFEQANLDFALIYRDAFAAVGDHESAAVLQRVHEDEIRHVRLAVRWLRRLKAPGESDVAAYARAIPFPLSAARAKGRRFDSASRKLAGFDDEFIAYVAQAEPYRPPASATPVEGGARLWLLPNLGAEEEQAVPASARGFLRGLYGAWATLFDGSQGTPWLLPPGDEEAQRVWRQALALPSGELPSGAAFPCLEPLDRRGELIAWLNTPNAEKSAQAHRLPLCGPSPAVTRQVHDKAFAQFVSTDLDLHPPCLRGLGAVFSVEDCADSARAMARLFEIVRRFPDWIGRRFVIKPRLSTSGRGQVIAELRDGEITPPIAAASWQLFADRGGCVVEPWLERLQDLSVQLLIGPRIEILGTTTQMVTQSGRILGNRGLVDASGALRSGADVTTEAGLCAAAQTLGEAAANAGFFGIAGVDAFLFRGPDGQPTLRAVVELNARFTTGTVALGLVRRLAATGKLEQRRSWALRLKAPPKLAIEESGDVLCVCPLSRGPALIVAESPERLSRFLEKI